MNAFVHAESTRGTCAFRDGNLDASGVGFADTQKEQRTSGTVQAQVNGFLEDTLSAPSAQTDPAPHETLRETRDGVATAKPAEPASGMPAPNRLLEKHALPSRNSMSVDHYYRWILTASVLILVLALLALLGVAGTLLYLRWFSEPAILARAVNRGLRRNEFHLEYQPVFYTKTRKCIGLEVVLRWKNVAYGLRGETWYMDKLADRRLAMKIVAFVLSTAGKELDRLADGRTLYVMINLWASYLDNEECLSLIAARARSFTSSRLVFQVRADDLPQQLSSMTRLREDKLRLALSAVRAATSITATALPVGFEFIKVDRDVMGLEESQRLRTLRAIAAAGRELDVVVIADGVEGSAQYDAVGRAGIDLAQGFFLGKAIPVGLLPAFFERLDWWQGKYIPTASAADPA